MFALIGGAIAALIKAGGEIGSKWLDNKKAKAEGKIAITKAKAEFKVKRFEAQAEMDVSAMNQMQFTWKDEYLLFLFSIPLVLCFIPYMVPYITAGFAVLQGLPMWYQWSITGMVAATFGLRTWQGVFKK